MAQTHPPSHGLRLGETGFHVIHRRREYGPFDYEWTDDLRSVLLTYRGRRFGEVCNRDTFYADLREFRLPRRVVEVAMLALGSLLHSISCGHSSEERSRFLVTVLRRFDCERFAPSHRAS
jgi:hypothetical protein